MSEEYFFIINPSANNGRALHTWSGVKKYLDVHGIQYGYRISKDIAELPDLAREAAVRPDRIIVGVGGDGTISKLAGVLAGTRAILGIIPAGTGNDYARTWQIPQDPQSACQILRNGQVVLADIGCFRGGYFCNTAGVGLDADVVAEANSRWKRYSGRLGYLLALMRQLIIYRPQQVTMLLDDQELTCVVWLVSVANGRYFGSGMMVAPQADPQDGLAEVVIVEKMTRLEFLRFFPSVYKGEHIFHRGVRVIRASRVVINTDRPLSVQADGEVIGITPFDLTIKHQVIRLQVPPGIKRRFAV